MPTCMELALYNGALSGLARDGEHYFYDNPLESDGSHSALGLAHLPMLHHERVAARRLGRRLFLLAPAPTPSRCISMAASPPT